MAKSCRSGGLALVWLIPLILFNLRTSGTLDSIFGNLGESYYGVNNSAQSINGSRTDTFSWNLDGADNKDNGGGGNNFVNVNPDAIAEFKVLTSNYGAQYGRNGSALAQEVHYERAAEAFRHLGGLAASAFV